MAERSIKFYPGKFPEPRKVRGIDDRLNNAGCPSLPLFIRYPLVGKESVQPGHIALGQSPRFRTLLSHFQFMIKTGTWPGERTPQSYE